MIVVSYRTRKMCMIPTISLFYLHELNLELELQLVSVLVIEIK